MFKEMKEKTYIKLACKILYHSETKKNKFFIFDWDGIDTTKCHTFKPIRLTYVLTHLQLEHSPLSRDILCTF